VVVFEPAKENLKYLFKNVELSTFKNIVVIQKGAGHLNEEMEFFIDPITGQNNSLVPNFKGFYENRKNSGSPNAELIPTKINVIKLDDYCDSSDFYPDFVKIDVEGFEWNVVQGFIQTIEKFQPSLMIEIQSDSEKIITFFKERNYIIESSLKRS
jgi:FkbM family methyltransferase